jgi:transposase
MMIIGCDFHPSFQEVAILDDETGELGRKRVGHPEEVREFYASLAPPVRVGMEACGYSQWFERMLGELGHEV